MTQLDDPLDRLFKAVAQAPVEAPDEMRPGFDARVVVARRLELEEPLPWNTLLRGALVCSALIMLFSLAVNYHVFQTEALDEMTLADAVIRTSFNP